MKTQMFSIQDDAPLVEQAKLRASLTLVPDVSNYEDLERPAPGVAARGVHPAALGSLVGLYAVMLLSFWVSFARSGPAALVLTVVTVLMIMYFSLIVGGIILADSAVAGEVQRSFAEFLRGRVDILTGPISGGQAMVQLLLMPACLVALAIAIGIIARVS